MGRRPIRRQRTPVFLGCEGESEVAYGQLVHDLLRQADLPIHLHIEPLAPAGDPLTRVQRALRIIPQRQSQRAAFHLKFILMDSDQALYEPQRAEDARQLAARNDISIIWQDPCHEALLLRHLPNLSGNRPVDSRAAERDLKRVWPEYEKPMTRAALAGQIDLDAVRQASTVESELRAFLGRIGLIP